MQSVERLWFSWKEGDQIILLLNVRERKHPHRLLCVSGNEGVYISLALPSLPILSPPLLLLPLLIFSSLSLSSSLSSLVSSLFPFRIYLIDFYWWLLIQLECSSCPNGLYVVKLYTVTLKALEIIITCFIDINKTGFDSWKTLVTDLVYFGPWDWV